MFIQSKMSNHAQFFYSITNAERFSMVNKLYILQIIMKLKLTTHNILRYQSTAFFFILVFSYEIPHCLLKNINKNNLFSFYFSYSQKLTSLPSNLFTIDY